MSVYLLQWLEAPSQPVNSGIQIFLSCRGSRKDRPCLRKYHMKIYCMPNTCNIINQLLRYSWKADHTVHRNTYASGNSMIFTWLFKQTLSSERCWACYTKIQHGIRRYETFELRKGWHLSNIVGIEACCQSIISRAQVCKAGLRFQLTKFSSWNKFSRTLSMRQIDSDVVQVISSNFH